MNRIVSLLPYALGLAFLNGCLLGTAGCHEDGRGDKTSTVKIGWPLIIEWSTTAPDQGAESNFTFTPLVEHIIDLTPEPEGPPAPEPAPTGSAAVPTPPN